MKTIEEQADELIQKHLKKVWAIKVPMNGHLISAIEHAIVTVEAQIKFIEDSSSTIQIEVKLKNDLLENLKSQIRMF